MPLGRFLNIVKGSSSFDEVAFVLTVSLSNLSGEAAGGEALHTSLR